ncbi:MAG TPA: EFR1 family ferrodoxin [Methanoregula sp.]|nr:EFR1 family ferrodoxin [Methanoregula sp.]
MKTIIYYFTGTGNSLAAARTLAAALGDCEMVPIASLKDTTGTIIPEANRVGIVCPVYFSGLPSIVASFVKHLDLTSVRTVFAMVTHGGGGGDAALRQMEGILRSQHGQNLDAGFTVAMPGNYILMYESPTGEKQAKILADADTQVREFARALQQGNTPVVQHSLVTRVLHTLIYPWFLSHVHDNDRKFSVTAACTSCSTCVSVCPVNNIELVDKKPVWKHHCELCCGCIHLCPVQAIQAGRGTETRERYHNPSVSVADLKGLRERRP